MSFDWREYLHLARFLATVGSGFSQEAVLRSAVSRAYYAAFCHARNFARDRQGFSPTHTPKDHDLVRTHFKNQGRVDIARHLETLRRWRNRCDYDDTVSNVSNLLASAIAQAQKVLDSLK
jgi:uncharacterized protein (UPF0332 family)